MQLPDPYRPRLYCLRFRPSPCREDGPGDRNGLLSGEPGDPTASKCKLCGSPADGVPVLHGRDYEYAVAGEWALARCGTCGFLYHSPLPAPEAIASVCPNTYSAYTSHRAT